MKRLILLGFLAAIAAEAEQPVGLVVVSETARVQRRGDRTTLAALKGELLLPGDGLIAGTSDVQLVFCPHSGAPFEYTLSAGGSAVLSQTRITGKGLKAGPMAPYCALPDVSSQSEPAQGAACPAPSTGLTAKLQGLLEMVLRDPGSLLARVTQLAVYQQAVPEKAASAAVALAAESKAAWISGAKGFTLPRAAVRTESGSSSGSTFAISIGVSKYLYSNVPSLQFADADAELFSRHMGIAGKLPKALETPDDQAGLASHYLLKNGVASKSILEDLLIRRLVSQPKPGDSVFLYLSGHGMKVDDQGAGYFMVTDTKPSEPHSSALSLEKLREVIRQLSCRRVKVALFLDICHAGSIAAKTNRVGDYLRGFVASGADVYVEAAAQGSEEAYESQSFGGGHGAFSYFLIRGLNLPKADLSKESSLRLSPNTDLTHAELDRYVQRMVRIATYGRQRPMAWIGGATRSDMALRGLEAEFRRPPLAKWSPKPAEEFSRRSVGRVVQHETTRLAADVPERLRLLTEAEGILHRYLEGDEVPEARGDFARGLAIYERVRQIGPDSAELESREAFYRGRLLVFDRKFEEALPILERAVALLPEDPVAFNALGMAYLGSARIPEAIAALEDAVRRAPLWSYPVHNLALVHQQRGDFREAERRYKEVIALAPSYGSPHHNLGLLYQLTNRPAEARMELLEAKRRFDQRPIPSAAPSIALGVLAADAGKDSAPYFTEARQILATHPDPLNETLLHHNEGVTLSRDPNRREEAATAWRNNPEYVPSLSALGALLAAPPSGERPPQRDARLMEATAVLKRAVHLAPEYLGARLALAQVYEDLGDIASARAQHAECRQRAPENPMTLRRFAAFEARQQRAEAARELYQAALRLTRAAAARKEIEAQLRRLP